MSKRFALLILFVAFRCIIGSAEGETKVGVLAAFTGDGAAYGAAYRHGIELAGVADKATFMYEDDGFQPAKSVSAFRKLTTIDRISSVLVGDTVTAQAVAPLARQQGVQLLAWASSDRVFVGNPVARRLWTTNAKDHEFARDEVVRRGYKRVALFTSTHPYCSGWGEAIRDRVPGSTLQDFATDPGSFQAHILKLKSSGVDAVGLCLFPGSNGLFARQMRDVHVSLPLFGCDFVESSADISAAGEAFDGIWFTAPKISREFIEEHRKRFGTTDHIVSAAIFHDAATMLVNGEKGPFVIEGMKWVEDNGDRHVDFSFSTYEIKGGVIQEVSQGEGR
jgi:branched-chain amino acid transport system substrate-binding protein